MGIASEEERESLRYHRVQTGAVGREKRSGVLYESEGNNTLFWACSLIGEQSKETLRKLEEENENIKAEGRRYSTQLESTLSKQNTSQKMIQELNNEVSRQKPQGSKKL